jgi:serine/threonine-protein kinase
LIGRVLRIRYEVLAEHDETSPIFDSYLGRDRVQARDVALRVFKPNLTEVPAMASRLQSVIHKFQPARSSQIESMFAVEEDEGTYFLVSDLSKGISLTRRVKQLAPFSAPVVVGTAVSLAEALDPIHQLGLAHGDLNGNNVIVQLDNSVRVILPGIWEIYSALSTAGVLVLPSMSPYLAPEVSLGGLPNPTSDVYSVGVLMFELLSAKLPFQADNPVTMAIRHQNSAVPSVRMYNPGVPMVLDEIIKKCLVKDPAKRYGNASDLLHDLRMVQDALRFGKTLTWPLRVELVGQIAEPAEPKELVVGNVAPAMGAARPEADEKPAKKTRERIAGDVPVWLMVMTAFVAAIALTMLGMWFWQFSGKAKSVRVPKVKGLKLAEAGRLLRETGLQMKLIGTVPSKGVPADVVMDQQPGPDMRVGEGSVIYVKKSPGADSVQMPKIIGMKVNQARDYLAQADLRLDENTEKVNYPGVVDGAIIDQDPKPFKMVQKGARIKVRVQDSGTNATGTLRADDARIASTYNLNIRLRGISEPVMVRVVMLDALGQRELYNKQGKPEEQVQISATGYGGEVYFEVYYNDTRVYRQRQVAPKDATRVPTDDGGGGGNNNGKGDGGAPGEPDGARANNPGANLAPTPGDM